VIAVWQQLAVGGTVAAQFISHYRSGLGSPSFYHTLKKALGCRSITPLLYINISHFIVLVNRTP
jgi:hypothetical protein